MRYSIIILLFFLITFFSGPTCLALKQDLEAYKDDLNHALEKLEAGQGELQEEELSLLKKLFPYRFTEKTEQKREVLNLEQTGNEKKEDLTWAREDWLSHLKTNIEHLSTKTLTNKPSDWPELRAGLERVYQSKEFSRLKGKDRYPWEHYIQNLLQRIARWLDEHSGSIGGLNIKGLDFIFYGIIIAACIILILWIRPKGLSLPKFRRNRKTQQESVADTPDIKWRDYRAQAYQCYQNQAFRDAVRAFFISVLWEGNEKGWWIYEPELTNREQLKRVTEPVPRREALQRLMRIYESAWYGLGKPGIEVYQECEVCLEKMETAK